MQEELYIAFENYLNNEMTFEDRSTFENQLQEDANLKEQFELYKQTTQFLEVKFSKETIDFKDNLKSISKDYFANPTKHKTKVISLQSKWFAVAAMLIIFIGFWYFIQGGNPSYSDYNNHNEAHFVERSQGNPSLKEAEKAFNAKEYAQAVTYFESIPKEDLGIEESLFYAISLIEVNAYDKSDVVLLKIKEGNSAYKEDATWYLALSSLKQEKYVDCKKYLEQITEDSEKYSSAQILLNDLD